MALDQALVAALDALVIPGHWAHLATVAADGGPHNTPVALAYDADVLYLSVTGKQKIKNIERDPRICIALSRDGDLGHVTIWGTCELQIGSDAQTKWEWLIRKTMGDGATSYLKRKLSLDGTRLGIITPSKFQIYGMD